MKIFNALCKTKCVIFSKTVATMVNQIKHFFNVLSSYYMNCLGSRDVKVQENKI